MQLHVCSYVSSHNELHLVTHDKSYRFLNGYSDDLYNHVSFCAGNKYFDADV